MTLCGCEGNRWSGVALAMRHGLSGLSTFGLNGHRKGDEHPTYTPSEYGPFTVFTWKLLVQYAREFIDVLGLVAGVAVTRCARSTKLLYAGLG